jgi:hypothetical protein
MVCICPCVFISWNIPAILNNINSWHWNFSKYSLFIFCWLLCHESNGLYKKYRLLRYLDVAHSMAYPIAFAVSATTGWGWVGAGPDCFLNTTPAGARAESPGSPLTPVTIYRRWSQSHVNAITSETPLQLTPYTFRLLK